MKKIFLLACTVLLLGPSLAWSEAVQFKDSIGIEGNVNASGQYEINSKKVLYQSGENLFLGHKSGESTIEPDAEGNTYLGIRSGRLNKHGSFNTYVGAIAGLGVIIPDHVMADNNVFVGYRSANQIQGGDDNVVIGYDSAINLDYGYQNILIGSEVGSKLTDRYDNVMIGYRAGQGDPEGLNSSLNNVFIGSYAGQDIGTGKDNVFVGHKSGEDNTTGSNNVYLGTAAGWYNQTGSGNIFIGWKAGGHESITDASNQLYIDNSETLTPLIHGDFGIDKVTINGDLWVTGEVSGKRCCPSDIRLKENIAPIGSVLAKVTAINGVRFNWKPDTKEARWADGDQAQLGVVAQDVEKVFPELVQDNRDGFKTVDYQKLVAPLIEAVKELRAEKDREIAALKAEKDKQIGELKARLQALEARPG